MSMKRCPICGEKYSDSYRSCPFCEEEESLRKGEVPRHRGGHRASQREPSLLSPVLIFLILVMVGVLVYLLFGDTIAAKLGLSQTPQIPAASMSEPAAFSSADASAPDVGGANTNADDETQNGTTPSSSVTLSNEDFTLKAGETYALTASDGSGDYTWESDDDGIASVSSSGTVTAIATGTATVTVSDGSTSATCIVRVKGGETASGASTTSASLSKNDFTLSVGDTYLLKVSGTSSAATWTTSNASVATVSGGTVKAVGKGNATVTATVDGKTLKCIVRVS